MFHAVLTPIAVAVSVAFFAGPVAGQTLTPSDPISAVPDLPSPQSAKMRRLSQLFWDEANARLARRSFEVLDMLGDDPLDLVWKPSQDADWQTASDPAARLIWLRTGAAPYDSSQIMATYSGALHDGRPHGAGTFWLRSGAIYRGDWVDGRMQGAGHLRFSDGREYNGAFVAGEFHGPGRLTERDGTVHSGAFENGALHGTAHTYPREGRSFVATWHHGVRSSQRSPVSGEAGLAHIIPAQQRDYDDARIGVSVQTTFPAGYGPGDILLYKGQTEGGTLRVEPGDPVFLQRWRGDAPLPVIGDFRWNNSQFNDGYHRPAAFDLSLENAGQRPLNIIGGYLAVDLSLPDVDPALEVWRSVDCGQPTITRYELRNFGWAQPENAYIEGAFLSARTSAPIEMMSGYVYDGWPLAGFDFMDGLRNMGLNVELLANESLSCPGGDHVACLDQARNSGVFGVLADAVYLQDANIYATFEGALVYDWQDATGRLQRKSSRVSMPVKVGQFPWQVQFCAEGGEAMQIYPNPFFLEAQGLRYERPFPMSANVAPGTIARWNFQIDAPMSSRHLFRVVLQLADGREVASRAVDLTYMKPASPWGN